jgi:hypothetical protein
MKEPLHWHLDVIYLRLKINVYYNYHHITFISDNYYIYRERFTVYTKNKTVV